MTKLTAPDDDIEDAPTVDQELATIGRLKEKLAEFSRDAARQGLSALAVGAYEGEIKSQIEVVTARINAMVADPVLEKIVGSGAREVWADMDLLQRREVIRRSIEVTICKLECSGRWYTDIGVRVRPIGSLARDAA